MIGPDKNRELALMVIWQGAELLVQDRTHSEEDGLGFFGGRVKEGETALEAALRETGEEIKPEIEQRIRRQGVSGEFEPITDGGWLINFFQATLPYDEQIQSIEGRAVRILPLDMWQNSKLMSASRAVLKEIILIPNGIIDN